MEQDQKYRKELALNVDYIIQRRLIERYNVCFSYYRDFTCLVALIAMGGLLIAIARWEKSFDEEKRGSRA